MSKTNKLKTPFKVYVDFYTLVAGLTEERFKEIADECDTSQLLDERFRILTYLNYHNMDFFNDLVDLVGLENINVVIDQSLGELINLEQALFTKSYVDEKLSIVGSKHAPQSIIIFSQVLPNQCILIDADLKYGQQKWSKLNGRFIHYKNAEDTLTELKSIVGVY
jgi:hypothetical protein